MLRMLRRINVLELTLDRVLMFSRQRCIAEIRCSACPYSFVIT